MAQNAARTTASTPKVKRLMTLPFAEMGDIDGEDFLEGLAAVPEPFRETLMNEWLSRLSFKNLNPKQQRQYAWAGGQGAGGGSAGQIGVSEG